VSYPKITIVTCSYNQGKFLEEAIRSVLDQGYPNLEYIIMDGGSTDNSVEIIRRYEDRVSYWVSRKDAGQSDALASGFERATGEVLGWLCSDDLLEPGALFEVGQMFLDNPDMDVVFGDTIFVDERSVVTRRYKTLPFSRWLLLNTANYVPQPSTFWRRRIYEQVGGLNRTLHMGLDPDLWLRFSETGQIRHVRKYWSRMRFYPEIKSLTMRPQMLAEHRKLETRYLGDRPTLVRNVIRAAAKCVRIAWKTSLGCYWT
jgi:glycosyltransferase involved in cell wall biosynthesis